MGETLPKRKPVPADVIKFHKSSRNWIYDETKEENAKKTDEVEETDTDTDTDTDTEDQEEETEK